MIRKIAAFSLSLLLVLSGCSVHTDPLLPTETVETTALISEPTTEPFMITEAPHETTLPTIDIPAGAHACRFTGEQHGDYLDYYLFVPQNAVDGMPLIIFLHGDGEVDNPDSLVSCGPIRSLLEHYGEDFPCILLSPCTRTPSWTDGTIPGTLMDLIESVADKCDTDRNRVIITGYSRGAIGVWYLISEYGDYFSAAVPVSCGADRAMNYENASKVPIYAMAGNYGYNENIYKQEMENLVSAIQAENGLAVFECLDGCTHLDTLTAAYSKAVIEWMLEQ